MKFTRIPLQGKVVHCQTDDCCIIETGEIAEVILKMTQRGWTLIYHIADDDGIYEKSILYFGKGKWRKV